MATTMQSRRKLLRVGPSTLVGLRILWPSDLLTFWTKTDHNDIFAPGNDEMAKELMRVVHPVVLHETGTPNAFAKMMPSSTSNLVRDDNDCGVYSGDLFTLDYRWVNEPEPMTIYIEKNIHSNTAKEPVVGSIDYRTQRLWPRTLWATLSPVSSASTA